MSQPKKDLENIKTFILKGNVPPFSIPVLYSTAEMAFEQLGSNNPKREAKKFVDDLLKK